MKKVFGVLLLLLASVAGATPISDKYSQLGGAGGFLGSPTIAESTTPDGVGKFRHYQHGSIYFHPLTGAHEVHGLIRQRWSQLGWELSYLGYPMTDEIDLVDGTGRVTKFQGGELIWRSATNLVSEVKSTDLVVDVPFPVGEAWQIIQANAQTDADSHRGPWVYCWDLTLAGQPQSKSEGRSIAAAASARIVHVDESFSGSNNSGNIVIQRFGEGRFGSYLHIKQGSYTKKMVPPNNGINFLPQALPWGSRPFPSTGKVLAEVGDTGANAGAFHLHFCVTTRPDRDAYKPFESVPVAFRNYSFSTNNGQSWTYVPVGVPRAGQWIRRETAKAGQKSGPEVTNAATLTSHGTVKGQVVLSGDGKPKSPGGKITVGLTSAWGEPLGTKTITVDASNLNGPWAFTFNDVPAYNGTRASASYTGAWTTAFDFVNGESAAFNVPPNGTASPTVKLKTTLIH
jgi:hypothetical protein